MLSAMVIVLESLALIDVVRWVINEIYIVVHKERWGTMKIS